MGGNATFAGTTHQARVIAFIYVHILAQRPLEWLGAVDDTPSAVSAETKGPGDDARIEYVGSLRPVEVQAKHGLSGMAKLREAVETVRNSSLGSEDTTVVLAVDREGSVRALRDFAQDFDRLRSGRREAIKTDTVALISALSEKGREEVSADQEAEATPLGSLSSSPNSVLAADRHGSIVEAERLLRRIYVVPVDLDDAHDLESKLAIEILRGRLEDTTQVAPAWALLVEDAADISKRRLRRTRKDLVAILESAGIRVRPPAKDDRWHRILDGTKRLLQKRHAKAALATLIELEEAIATSKEEGAVDPEVYFRLAQHTANALIHLDRPKEAITAIGRALDTKPADVLALSTASAAAILCGDVELARGFAVRAIAADDANPRAWAALAQVTSANGEPLPTPPPVVAESVHYRGVLAHIAAEAHETATVLSLTNDLLREGHREADILFLRANALMGPPTSDEVADRDRFATTERLATEIIEQLHDDFHPMTVTAYVLRASARRRLGRDDEADADLSLAHSIGTDDPNAIGHTARARIDRNDMIGALDALRHPIVDQIPDLLGLRARIHATEGDQAAARRDLASTLALMPKAFQEDRVRILVADVALLLGDSELAESTLAGVSVKGQELVMFSLANARLAFSREDYANGEELYRRAADKDRENRDDILVELGQLLLKANRPDAAVKAFEDTTRVPPHAIKLFAAALYEANELLRAQALIESIAADGPLPDWALGLATDIARRQGDSGGAIAHLTQLVERATQSPQVRITLVNLLIENGRIADATPHLDILRRWTPPTASERMQVAQLLHKAGRFEDAMSLAFRAFRDAPNDPQMHRAFIGLTLTSKTEPRSVTAVGPNTWVRLTRKKGSDREHTIFADEPIDPTRDEMSVADAEAASLIGKVVGDEIVRNEGTWQEQRWTVAEVQPAELHALRVAAREFEYRFPAEPFFLTSIEIGDGTSIGAFEPIAASLRERRLRVKQVAGVYHEHVLPLGMVALLLGGTIADAMDYFGSEEGGRLWVEWADPADQAVARAAASTTDEVVLTRSAIRTVFLLGLEDVLAATFKLLTPQTLHDELRAEIADAERLVVDGQHILMSGEAGLQSHEVEAGHPSLKSNRELRQRMHEWLEQKTLVLVRPLASVQASNTAQEESREKIGRSSADAIALVQHRNATLYADDLGLRKLAPESDRAVVSAFSSVTLLAALAQRGLLSDDDRERHLLTLVVHRYAHVMPTVELLRLALREQPRIGQSGVAHAFLLLTGPQMTPAAAANLVVAVVKAEMMAPVQLTPPELIFSVALAAMATHWPAPLCARSVARAVGEGLALFPVAQQAFVNTAQTYLRQVAERQLIRPEE